MKKSKKLRQSLSISLTMVMLFGGLSACGDTNSGNGKNSQAASNNQSADSKQSTTSSGSGESKSESKEEYKYTGSAPVTQEKKTITVLTSNGASLLYDFDNMSWWQEALKRANVELQMELVESSTYRDVVTPKLAAGVGLPDLVKLASLDQDMSYINSNIFLDLTDYYDKLGVNLNKQFEKAPQLKSEMTTPDGKLFYIPYIFKTHDSCRTIMVNQEWLKQLNLQEPKDTEEFYQMLKAMKGVDFNKNGKDDEVPLFMRKDMTQLFGTHWGLDLIVGFKQDDNGVVTCSYEQPEYLDLLKYFNKLYTEGLLYSEFSTANFDTQTALFGNNQIGSILHFSTNCTGYSKRINPDWDQDKDTPIMIPIMPIKGPKGDAYYTGRDKLGGFFGISKDCKDPELVFAFADYLFSEEVAKLTWWGVENVDYTVENNEVKFSAEYRENKDNFRGNKGFNFDGLPGMQYEIVEANQHPDVNKAMAKNLEFIKDPIGFSFCLPDEIEVTQSYSADLRTYFSEKFVGFITGTTPFSEWDKYLQDLKAMHVDDMVKVYQAQCDRKSKNK